MIFHLRSYKFRRVVTPPNSICDFTIGLAICHMALILAFHLVKILTPYSSMLATDKSKLSMSLTQDKTCPLKTTQLQGCTVLNTIWIVFWKHVGWKDSLFMFPLQHTLQTSMEHSHFDWWHLFSSCWCTWMVHLPPLVLPPHCVRLLYPYWMPNSPWHLFLAWGGVSCGHLQLMLASIYLPYICKYSFGTSNHRYLASK